MPTANHFWLVWRENDRNPTFVHKTKESAVEEAKRLAVKHPGSAFYIMQSLFGLKAIIPEPEIDVIQLEKNDESE